MFVSAITKIRMLAALSITLVKYAKKQK